MAKRRWLMGAMSLTVLWGLAAAPAAAQAPSGPVKMEWLSWSIFRFTSPTGKVVLTNPFVMNPDSPVRFLQTDNPNLKTIIPHHHRLKPPAGAPTPADLEKVLKAARLSVKVLDPELSKIDELTK